jgi:hypothetical protein
MLVSNSMMCKCNVGLIWYWMKGWYEEKISIVKCSIVKS